MVILHVWFIGTRRQSGEIAGINNVRPLFLLFGFFCLVEILLNDSGVEFYGISGLGGHDILVHLPSPDICVLSFIILVAGSLMEILLSPPQVDSCQSA